MPQQNEIDAKCCSKEREIASEEQSTAPHLHHNLAKRYNYFFHEHLCYVIIVFFLKLCIIQVLKSTKWKSDNRLNPAHCRLIFHYELEYVYRTGLQRFIQKSKIMVMNFVLFSFHPLSNFSTTTTTKVQWQLKSWINILNLALEKLEAITFSLCHTFFLLF